ncbi:MAG: penicillin-binding protein 2 [Alphaproteobacteria bacterium]|nr:penicillin-binding protein 2 [Alphaproteobacteria bacterium]MDD9919633.1 penicillin-binding protein 2 [Alphaproteobacteria bacterium]
MVKTPAKNKKYTQRRRVKVRAEQGYVKRQQQDSCAHLRMRAMLTLFVLCLGFSSIGLQLGHVALAPAQEPRASIRDLPPVPTKRGDIYDAHGQLLATTLEVPSVYADPKRVLDAEETAEKLAGILPQVNQKRLSKILGNNKRRFAWVQRQITPEQAFQINTLGLPGISFRYEQVRVYPQRRLAAHVLGGINVDGRGLAGVESSFDEKLMKGKDVHLTLDSRLQEQLRESLAEAYEESSAKGAWGIVLDARTGDIRAMASLPDYDPNHYGNASNAEKFNPMTFGRYEMGSTFKLFTLAQGLAEGVVTPESEVDCRKPLKIGKYTIRDYHAKKRVLTATEVLRYSSNIGAAQIADAFGGDQQRAFFSQLGLLEPLDVGLPEMIAPSYPANWGRVHTITMSFGHGIAVTPLQLAAAVATVSTDGHYRRPRLIADWSHDKPRPVLGANTVAQVKELMRDVVINGSGRKAQVAGLDIGGKTGTAEKVSRKGGYSESKNLVSFVGAVPLDKPELVTLIMVDEPKKGYETGGRIAGPAFQSFVRRSMPLLAMAPQPQQAVQVARKQGGIKKQGERIYASIQPIGTTTR